MNATYRGHTIICTKLGFCFIDDDNTLYNDLHAAKEAIDQIEVKRRVS